MSADRYIGAVDVSDWCSIGMQSRTSRGRSLSYEVITRMSIEETGRLLGGEPGFPQGKGHLAASHGPSRPLVKYSEYPAVVKVIR